MPTESPLIARKCLVCDGNLPSLNHAEQSSLLKELGGGWCIERGHHLEKEYRFPDFRQALCFTIQIGEMAEREGHHPDIYLSWGKVKVHIWTHSIDGLTENDFILASKCDHECSHLMIERACF